MIHSLPRLIERVYKFRKVLETIKFPDYFISSFNEYPFPKWCCDESSILLARHLIENGYTKIKLIKGYNSEIHCHYWLEIDGYTIDITIDQFNSHNFTRRPVIISRCSKFHKGLNIIFNQDIDLNEKKTLLTYDFIKTTLKKPGTNKHSYILKESLINKLCGD